ncbi:hypothetical protein BT63DRAFT_361484, partial [Microthyrium microscopicum]
RTSIMVRNIPNKMQPWELKRLLDAVIPGRYDFMYLRLDFRNQCNVGYAFINVVESTDLVPLSAFLTGVRWGILGSNKVPKLCFGTIQGLPALTSHFQNSSVMAQWAPLRAHTYYTCLDQPGKVPGREAPFPEP